MPPRTCWLRRAHARGAECAERPTRPADSPNSIRSAVEASARESPGCVRLARAHAWGRMCRRRDVTVRPFHWSPNPRAHDHNMGTASSGDRIAVPERWRSRNRRSAGDEVMKTCALNSSAAWSSRTCAPAARSPITLPRSCDDLSRLRRTRPGRPPNRRWRGREDQSRPRSRAAASSGRGSRLSASQPASATTPR